MSNLALQLVDEVTEQESFSVSCDNSAEWAIKKIAEETAEAQRFINVCDTMIKEYQFKRQKAQEHLDTKTSYLKGLLQQYFETVPHKATKTQETYKLPSGTLKRKFGGVEYVRNDEVLLAWLQDNNHEKFIKIKESPDWAELKKTVTISGNSVVTAEGEIVGGVMVTEKEDKFEIEF